MKTPHFLNVVPFFPDDVPYMAEELRRVWRETGLDSPAICISLHPEGTPAKAKAERYIAAFAALMKEMKSTPEIHAGVLIQSTLGHGWSGSVPLTRESWTHIVDIDGVESSRMCHLDAGFRKYITDSVRALAALGPAFFLVDDDFGSRWNECYCPLHVAEFSRGLEKPFTREELAALVRKGDPADPLYQKFEKIRMDSQVNLAKEIRAAIDSADPSIRCGMCCPWTSHKYVIETTLALAGNTEPFLRVANAIYLGGNPRDIIPSTKRAAVRINMAKGKITDLLDESDTFPQSYFSESATALNSHIATGLLFGLNGGKLWITNFACKDPHSGYKYERIIARNRMFYQGLLNLLDGVKWQGPVSPLFDWHRNYHTMRQGLCFEFQDWNELFLHRFGIPADYRETHEKCSRMLTGDLCDPFSDSEITEFFKGNLLLDSESVRKLESRGFSALMGVKTGENPEFFFTREKSLKSGIESALMWQKECVELIPLKGAVRGSELYDIATLKTGSKAAGPGMVFFTNKYGGRVCCLAWNAGIPTHKSMRNERRTLLIEALDFVCGGMELILDVDQDVMARCGVLPDGRTVLSVLNLNLDPLEGVSARTERKFTTAHRLCHDGHFTRLELLKTKRGFSISETLGTLEPAVYILE